MDFHARLFRARRADVFLEVGPRRLVAEPRADVGQEVGELPVAQRAGEAGHDRAALLVTRGQAPQDHVDHIAGVRPARPGAERKVDAAVRRRAAAVVAARAGGAIDGGAGVAGIGALPRLLANRIGLAPALL